MTPWWELAIILCRRTRTGPCGDCIARAKTIIRRLEARGIKLVERD